MNRSILLFLGLYMGLTTLHHVEGYEIAYDVGYSAISLSALVISITFLWLWRVRATPMALGMALSWAGSFGLVGFWWVFTQIGRQPVRLLERDVLFLFIALYLAGAILHIRVISAAYLRTRTVFWGIVLGLSAVSVGLSLTL